MSGEKQPLVLYNHNVDKRIIADMGLYFSNMRLSPNIPCDILFPSVSPSLAFELVQSLDLEVELKRLKAHQDRFKNAFAIAVDYDNTSWMLLQSPIPSGSLRLFRCANSAKTISKLIFNCFLELNDAEKLRKQIDYFHQLEAQVSSSRMISSILLQYFKHVGLDEAEAQLLIEGLPAAETIIRATKDELSQNCPIDINSINLIVALFQNNKQ